MLWAAHALPSVIALTGLPVDLADPGHQLPPFPLDSSVGVDGAEHLIERRGSLFRIHFDEDGIRALAVLLPLDQYFEIRAAAAIRFWRSLTGRSLGPDPATLPRARKDRLLLALRAVDARLDGATYREIASVLFGDAGGLERGWKGHDLRDRTIRLVRFGLGMMRSGYRRLLLYPYRRRS